MIAMMSFMDGGPSLRVASLFVTPASEQEAPCATRIVARLPTGSARHVQKLCQMPQFIAKRNHLPAARASRFAQSAIKGGEGAMRRLQMCVFFYQSPTRH
jgi:hypothetical protein